MFFNEYEVYQMIKIRQEEFERNERNAWKYEAFNKESLLQKLVRKWNSGTKSITSPQQNGCCCPC